MRTGFFMRAILVIVLLGALVALGAYVYNLGIAQGAAASLTEGTTEGQTLPAPYFYAPYYRPWGWGFGFFGLCFPFLAIFLIFAALRGLFFRRGWRGYGPHGRGWYGKGPGGRGPGWEGGIPPRVEEWHRKMHASEAEEASPAEPASS